MTANAPARRPRRSATEAADAIREATLELLVESGYTALTTDDIAARAGVSKATIYRNWRSKEALVIESASGRIPRLDVPDRGDLKAELEEYLRERLDVYRSDGVFTLIAGLLGGAATDDEMCAAMTEWVADLLSGPRGIVERAQARGEIRADLSADTLVTLISAPHLFRMLIEMVVPDEAFEVELADVLYQALRAPAGEVSER